jgi:hypothetical protein
MFYFKGIFFPAGNRFCVILDFNKSFTPRPSLFFITEDGKREKWPTVVSKESNLYCTCIVLSRTGLRREF